MLPNQNIPDDEKTKEWAEATAKAIIVNAQSHVDIKDRIKFCQKFHQGEIDQTDWDYLRKVGDYELPAFVRHIPLLKPMFEALKTDEYQRPFRFRVFTVDRDSIFRKKEERKMALLQKIEQKSNERLMQLKDALTQIQQIKQQIQAAEEQGQQVDPRLKQQLQEQELFIKRPLEYSTKEIEDIEKYYKLKHQDIFEILGEKGAKYLIKSQNLQQKFNEGFEDIITSDQEFYFIECIKEKPDPIFEVIDPAHFFYSMDNVDWVHECQWAFYERLMTPNAIIGRWSKLPKDTVDKIFRRTNSSMYYSSSFHSFNAYRAGNYGANGTIYENNELLRSASCVVKQIYWMAPRQFFFFKIVDENGKIKEDFVTKKSELPNGVEYELRYMNERWEAIIVDNDIVIEAKRSEYQMYDLNWNHHGLPFVGPNKWGRKKSNSLVWQTKDIQIMYDLVHYHKELWLALSGVKGFIMDKGQIPDDMEPEEWMFQRKMGVAWIERIKKNKVVDRSFNQFQQYDDTVSPAIQYLLKILEHYEQLAYKVTGISPQRLGQIQAGELVGNTEMSIKNSNLVTEIMYIEHEQTKRMAISKLINACRICWREGREAVFTEGNELAQDILSIPPQTFQKADYDVIVDDGGKEQAIMSSLKNMAANKQVQNIFEIPQMAKILASDNVKELEALLERYSEIAAQKAQAGAEAEANREAQLKQMENDIKLTIARETNSFEQIKLEIEKSRLESEIKQNAEKLALEKAIADDKNKVELYKIDSERGIESAYLKFEKIKAAYDARANDLQIQFEAVNNQLDRISQEKQKEKVKDK